MWFSLRLGIFLSVELNEWIKGEKILGYDS